jgi:hypothetical protein
MDTTLNPKQTDMRHGLVADADQELARAYEQITRADEQLVRAEEQLSKLEHDAAPRLRLARMNRRGRAVRGFTGLLLAAFIGIAAMVSQSSYGDTARPIIARWVPQYVPSSSPALENRALPAQPGLATVQAAAVDTASPQPAALAQSAPEGAAPTTAGLSPELTQLLQSMTRDLATVGQGIEQLKAGQEQMARDNANAAEQLKAIQEKMARVVAKASEQNLRPTSAPPLRPIATPTRKPVLTQQSPQARARPQAPTQLQPDDQ